MSFCRFFVVFHKKPSLKKLLNKVHDSQRLYANMPYFVTLKIICRPILNLFINP